MDEDSIVRLAVEIAKVEIQLLTLSRGDEASTTASMRQHKDDFYNWQERLPDALQDAIARAHTREIYQQSEPDLPEGADAALVRGMLEKAYTKIVLIEEDLRELEVAWNVPDAAKRRVLDELVSIGKNVESDMDSLTKDAADTVDLEELDDMGDSDSAGGTAGGTLEDEAI